MGLLLAQQDGLQEGYNARTIALQEDGAAKTALQPLDKAAFLLLSAVGEVAGQSVCCQVASYSLQSSSHSRPVN